MTIIVMKAFHAEARRQYYIQQGVYEANQRVENLIGMKDPSAAGYLRHDLQCPMG